MKHFKVLVLAGALMAAAACAEPAVGPAIGSTESSAPDATRALAKTEIANALRQGGKVIYVRHTITDFSKTDEAMHVFGGGEKSRHCRPVGPKGLKS